MTRVGDYLALSLLLHLSYWVLVAVALDHVIGQKDMAIRFRQAFIALAVFFAFTLLMQLFMSFNIEPIRLLPGWI